jgi:hypothetical protein
MKQKCEKNRKAFKSKVDSENMPGILTYSNRPVRAAVESAKEQGVKIVEEYSSQHRKVQPDIFVYSPLASTFCNVDSLRYPAP